MSSRVTLVTGGARSGKSSWAESLARGSGRAVAIIATAEAGDEEMARRIAAHRAHRPANWQVIEEPLDLVGSIRGAAVGSLVILDCLTVWTANLLASRLGDSPIEAFSESVWQAIEGFALEQMREAIDASRARGHWLIAITNEVGSGVVPAYPLGRAYRDLLGMVNAAAAAISDDVILMVAGLPIDLRKVGFDPAIAEEHADPS